MREIEEEKKLEKGKGENKWQRKEREIQELIKQFQPTVPMLPGERPQAYANRLRQMAEEARRKAIDTANAQIRSAGGTKGGKYEDNNLEDLFLQQIRDKCFLFETF